MERKPIAFRDFYLNVVLFQLLFVERKSDKLYFLATKE